jgi:hypothetical protein
MVGDLIFAIMPMFIIWKLGRSTLERCLISFLMTMGLFATGAGVLKIIYSKTYDRSSPDVFRAMMPVFLWCRMEEVLLIVASSAPLLKAPVEQALHRLGLPKFQNKSRELNSFHSFRAAAARHWHNLQSRHDPERGPTQGDNGMKPSDGKLEAGKYNSLESSTSRVGGYAGNSNSAGNPFSGDDDGGCDISSVKLASLKDETSSTPRERSDGEK